MRQPGSYVSLRPRLEDGRPRRRQPADEHPSGADAGQVQLLRGAARPHRAGGEDQSVCRRKAELPPTTRAWATSPQGQVCPLESAPTFVSDSRDFMRPLQAGARQAADVHGAGAGAGRGGSARIFIPFFRLHDSRYMVYWPQSTPANLARMRAETAARTRRSAWRWMRRPSTRWRRASSSRNRTTSSRARAPTPASMQGRHWRHASGWFSYELTDKKGRGCAGWRRAAGNLHPGLRHSSGDAGRRQAGGQICRPPGIEGGRFVRLEIAALISKLISI
jgi:hypothetical protein